MINLVKPVVAWDGLEREADVMPHKVEPWVIQVVSDVVDGPGGQVIQAPNFDFSISLKQPINQVGSDEAGASSHQDPLDPSHHCGGAQL